MFFCFAAFSHSIRVFVIFLLSLAAVAVKYKHFRVCVHISWLFDIFLEIENVYTNAANEERERETKQMKYALFADKLTRVFEKESRGKRAHSP